MKATSDEKWTTAVTDLITLTQKGRLRWEFVNNEPAMQVMEGGNYRYRAFLDGKWLLLTVPAGAGSSVWQFIRLDVLGSLGGFPEFRFPNIPALSGLAIAVQESIDIGASDIISAIHSALESV